MTQPLSAAWVLETAQGCGFELAGLARAQPLEGAFFRDWLALGLAADMDWLQERLEERLDVSRLVPGARTVVALACNYHRDDAPAQASPLARYARGRDYHYTMQDRLRALRRKLRERVPGLQSYSSVDAGALLEKVWAVRAGLGYVGKNGLLITPRFGSYVVLAGMVLDVEVDAYAEDADPAPPGPLGSVDRCGKCDLCIRACPTDAIDAFRRIDSRLCLSYQTIENEQAIPEALREGLAEANTVFGCDVCQSVCPLNEAPLNAAERFVPRAVAQLSVRELAALQPEQFVALARGTPLMRAGYDGLRRNAAYALGAARDAGAREVLEKLAQDSAERVREAAAWALQRLGAPGPGE